MYSAFNLSILECKFWRFKLYIQTVKLLISPYWNVNTDTIDKLVPPLALLISPYWNVNFEITLKYNALKPFNLSILECKSSARIQNTFLTRTFNLSILECKSANPEGGRGGSRTFNLSILECKCVRGAADEQGASAFNLSILECKWNKTRYALPHSALLISPYWNVNRSTCSFPPRSTEAFNLSILECKYNLPVHCAGIQKLLISPYWNVNPFPQYTRCIYRGF